MTSAFARSSTICNLLPAALLGLAGCPPPSQGGPMEPVIVPTGAATGAALAPEAPRGTCPAGMVWFAAGTFKMGTTDADEDAMPDDMPQHPVKVAAFCMATLETSVAEYESCVRAGKCTAAQPPNYPECNMGASGRQDHPINCVDFAQATAYCEAQGGRLPTEEEWEYAARGTTGRKYPWGQAPPDTKRLNACDEKCMLLGLKIDVMFETSDGFATTAPVGSFPKGATPEGLLDMAGNVAEWTSGKGCPYTEQTCADDKRIVRGGAWDMGMRATVTTWGRSAGARDPSEVSSGVGFRCARTP